MKQVIQLDANGYFVGFTTADISPLEPGVYLFPAGTIDAPTPTVPNGQRAKWANEQWTFEDISSPEPDPETELPELTYRNFRAMEYPPITDYLDGIVKDDQAQVQAYIDACLAVKAKYPKE